MKRRLVKTDADFNRCMTFELFVEVWHQGELKVVGKMESYTTDVIKVNGDKFLRSNCGVYISANQKGGALYNES